MATNRTLKLNLLADTTDFKAGIKQATGETKSFQQQVSANAKKIGKAFAVAGVAAGALAVKIGIDAVQAAAADEKSQIKLQKTLIKNTKATKQQRLAVESAISAMQMQYGVSDSDLRPAFEKLAIATGSVSKSTDLMQIAMDTSAGTGKSLDSVTTALAKAYNGNVGALKKLGIPLDANIIKTKDADAAVKVLSKTYGGQAAAAAGTFEGKMKILNEKTSEVKEQIGTALMPVVMRMADYINEKVVPWVQDFVDGFTGVHREGKGAVSSVEEMGKKAHKWMKTLVEWKDTIAEGAAALAAFWATSKIAGAVSSIVGALRTLRTAYLATTAVAATTASAEAAATGGASLAVAAPAMVALATYFGIKAWKWLGSGGNTNTVTGSHTGDIGHGYHGGRGGRGAPRAGQATVEPGSQRQGFRAFTPSMDTVSTPMMAGGNTYNTYTINLNGIVDADSARRTIENLFQRSSLRLGAINLAGSVL